MNSKNFRLVIFLLLMALAVVGVSGCGGSGGSIGNLNNKEEEEETVAVLEKLYDVDEDGIPDTLDFDDVEEVDYGKDEVIQNRKLDIPSRNYLKRLSAFDSPDTFVIDVTAGTEYTVEFSKGDSYQYPIDENVPHVEIINPQGVKLSFDLDPLSETLDADTIEHSVYPSDEPYMICLTFKPAVTGSYTIKLSRLDAGDDSDKNIYEDITLSVYRELRNENSGEPGYSFRYKLYDNNGKESSTISMNDVMELRKAWNGALENVIETQDITDEGESKVEIKRTSQVQSYLDCLSGLKQYYGIFDDYKELAKYHEINSYSSSSTLSDADVMASEENPNGTKIPAEIYGINYESMYDLGIGFTAITGAPAQLRAIKKSSIVNNIKVPTDRNVTSLYKATFVSSQEDAKNMSATTVEGSVQLGGFGFSAGQSSSSSFKFGLTSTTFVIHYEATEPNYRTLTDDEDYLLNGNAKLMLPDGASAFRNQFGDYFVGGYQYGGTYDAIITISTKTTEQLKTVKNHLTASFATEENAASADVGSKSRDFLKNNNVNISILIRTAGINDNGGFEVTKTTDITSIANTLIQFKEKLENTQPKDFQPVHVMLKRYLLLPEVFKMTRDETDDLLKEGYVPIPAAHSTKVLNFKRDMVTMHAYYNVLNDSNYMTMDTEVKNAYGRRYDNIKNTVNTQSETLFNDSNASQLESLHKEMLQLNKELKVIGDRYVFYQLLMAAQDQEKTSNEGTDVKKRPYGDNGGSIGYTSFMSSPAVNADISAGKDHSKDINQYTGSEWTPEFDAGSGYAFCYIKVTANNINDKERKANYPCIGTQKASFFFKCGTNRWLEWKVELKSMQFTQQLYPFSGLKQ